MEIEGQRSKIKGHVSETAVDLHIELYERNNTSGEEILQVRKVLQKVDPTITVDELCFRIVEEMMHGRKECLPTQGWGVFVPWTAEQTLVAGEAAEAHQDIEFKAQYLQGSRALRSYDITNGMTLHYKQKKRPLKFAILGQTKSVLIDESWIVYEICEEIGRNVHISSPDEYSLKTIDDPDRPEDGWLKGGLTLTEQKISLNAEIKGGVLTEPKPLIFKKKLYNQDYDRAVDTDDKDAMFLLYRQCKDMVTMNQLPVTDNEAVVLAALQLQIEDGDFDKNKHKKGYVKDWTRFLPKSAAKVSKIEDEIFKKYKAFMGTDQPAAVKKYVNLCKANGLYGWSFWPMKERVKAGTKFRQIPRLLGISGQGIQTLDPKTMKTLSMHPWRDVKKAGGENIGLGPGFYVEYAGEDSLFQCSMETLEALNTVIQYVQDYLKILMRIASKEAGDEGSVQSVWERPVGPSPMQFIPGKKKGKKGENTKSMDALKPQTLAAPMKYQEAKPKLAEDVEDMKRKEVNGRSITFPRNITPPDDDDKSPEDKENARLERCADQRDKIADLVGAINIGATNIIEGLGVKGASPLQPAQLISAIGMMGQMMDQLQAESATASGSAGTLEKAAEIEGAFKAVSKQTADFVGLSANLAALDDAGTIGALDMANLLLAAQQVGEAMKKLIGEVGTVATQDKVAEDLAREAAELVKAANEFAKACEATTFQGMPRTDADRLKGQIASLPALSSQYAATVGLTAPTLKLDAVRANLAAKTAVMKEMVETATKKVPIGAAKEFAAGQALEAQMAKIANIIKEAGMKPDFTSDIKDAASDVDKAVQQLQKNLDDPEVTKSCVKAVGQAATKLGQLASLEGDIYNLNGGWDGLLAAAQDLADAMRNLNGKLEKLKEHPDPDSQKEVAQAAALVEDATHALLMKRTHLGMMDRIAAACDKVVDDTDDLLGKFKDKAAADRALERTFMDAERTNARLESTCRIYGVEPTNLTRQDDLMQAARKACKKGDDLAVAAKTQGSPEAKESATAVLASITDLKNILKESAAACWPIDVNFALQTIRDAVKELEAKKGQVDDGTLKPEEKNDQSPLQWQENLLASMGTVPDGAKHLKDNAISATPPEMAQSAKDLANEIAMVASATIGMAAKTRGPESQRELLTACVTVAHDAADLIVKSETAAKKPSDPEQSRILAAEIEALKDSLHKLRMAIPGIGDCEKGIVKVKELSQGIEVSPFDMMGDLLAMAQKLAAAINEIAQDLGEPVAAIDPEKLAVEVQRVGPVEVFQNEIASAGRSLVLVVTHLPDNAVLSPEAFSTAAKRTSKVANMILEATKAASKTPEFAGEQSTLMVPLGAISEGVIRAFDACAKLGLDPADDKLLAEAKRNSDVGEAVGSLNSAFKAISVSQGENDLKEMAPAVTMLDTAIAGLSLANLPAPDAMAIKALQDALLAAAKMLADNMLKLTTTAETNPKRVGASAKETAENAVKIVNFAAQAASRISDGSTPAAGAASAAPGHTVHTIIEEPLKAVMLALGNLLKAKPEKAKKFKDAYTQVVLGVRDLLVEAKRAGKKLDGDLKTQLSELSDKVKADATKIAKTAQDYGAAPPEDEASKKKFMSSAKSLAQGLKALEDFSKATPVPKDEGEPNPLEGNLKENLVNAAKDVAQGVSSLIGAAKVVAADTTQAASQKNMHATKDKTQEKIDTLVALAELVTPGQKELRTLLRVSAEAADTLNNAGLDFSVQKLKGNPKDGYSECLAKLSKICDALHAGVKALGHAGYTSADTIGPAAIALAKAVPMLIDAAKNVALTAPDPNAGQRVLRGAKCVPESFVEFATAVKHAGGDPAQKSKLKEEIAKAEAQVDGLKALLQADEASKADCEAATAAIVECTKVIEKNPAEIQLIPGLGYEGYQKKVKTALVKLVKAAQSLVATAQKSPELIGVEAKALAEAFPQIMDAVAGCLALTGEPDMQQRLLANAQGCAAAVKGLVAAAGNVQVGSSDISNVTKASQEVSEQLQNLLKLVAEGATGKRAFEDAVRTIQSATTDLDTVVFLVNSKQLTNATGASFQDVSKKIKEANEELKKDVAEKLIPATDENSLAKASAAAGKDLGKLLELVELGASTLDTEGDQIDLLAAARDLANAMQGLLGNFNDNVMDASKRDPGVIEKFNGVAARMDGACDHAAEADQRAQAAVQALVDRVRALAGDVDKPGEHSGTDIQVQESSKGLLRASQKLLFGSRKGKEACIAAATNVPDAATTLVSAYRSVAATLPPARATEAAAALKRALEAVATLLESVHHSENEISDATKLVTQAITTFLSEMRRAGAERDGVVENADTAFDNELAAVLKEIEEALANLAALKDSPAMKAETDPKRTSFITLMITAATEISNASVLLVRSCVEAEKEKSGADHSDVMLAARNVAAGATELVSAATAFISKDADETALERAAKVMSAAILEVVTSSAKGAPEEGGSQKNLKKAAKEVGKACQALINAARALNAPTEEETASGAIKADKAASDHIRDLIEKRAKMEALQRDIDALKGDRVRKKKIVKKAE